MRSASAPRWTTADIADQSGRTFVVTGANAGIGLATTSALAERGARVIMACRNLEKAESARSSLGDRARERTEVRRLDLADLDSVREFAAATDERVDVLVNNAGLMGIPEARTEQGHEMQFGVNVLGHFALTTALEPRLTDRVVWLGSLAHRLGRLDVDDLDWSRRRYHPLAAYAQSKLACIMLAYEQQRRLSRAGSQVRAMAAHPGYTATELIRQSGRPVIDRVMALGNSIPGVGQTPGMGALPSLYAATVRDLRGGSFVGPHGLAGLRGHPTVASSSARSRGAEEAARLWHRCEELVSA